MGKTLGLSLNKLIFYIINKDNKITYKTLIIIKTLVLI